MIFAGASQIDPDSGDTVVVQAANATRRLRIVGEVEAFPTTDPERPIALVDIATLSLLRFAHVHSYQNVDEWWLDLSDAAAQPMTRSTIAVVRAAPSVASTKPDQPRPR